MLSVEQLAFGHPGRTVGRDVAFSLAAGEVLCLLGPNGSGKTTLLRTLLGLLPMHGGDVRLDGRSIRTLSRAEFARRAGYVPQAHAPYFAYSVADMVLMGRSAHIGTLSMPGGHDREVAARAMGSLGIAHLAERPVGEISSGERQLALIARALAQQPRLLVMDEPTASLDFGNQARVLEHIGLLAREGIAVVFSTHDPDHAFLCAHRVLLLAQGRALEVGTPRDVLRADSLERLYGVPVRVLPVEGGGHTCLPAVRG
jgi:iron complex transport system ATP-binding protein